MQSVAKSDNSTNIDKQLSLSALSDELSQVRTKKWEFLAEIDRIIPWEEWMKLIKPYYYKGERGNKPYDLERMLRIYRDDAIELNKIYIQWYFFLSPPLLFLRGQTNRHPFRESSLVMPMPSG